MVWLNAGSSWRVSVWTVSYCSPFLARETFFQKKVIDAKMKRVVIDPNPTATSRELAAMTGVSREFIQKLTRQGIIPKAARNRYELRKTLPQVYQYMLHSARWQFMFRQGPAPVDYKGRYIRSAAPGRGVNRLPKSKPENECGFELNIEDWQPDDE